MTVRSRRRGRRGSRGQVGDWETSDGISIVGPPAISAPPVWGGNLLPAGAGLPVNTFYTSMIAAQKPLQQPAGQLSVGAATISELDVGFDFSGFNPAAVPPQQAFAVIGVGIFIAGFSRGTNSFDTLDPLNGNDMTYDKWLYHKTLTFLMPSAQLIAASVTAIPQISPNIRVKLRRNMTIGQGQNLSVALSLIAPAGMVALSGVSWIRWKYSKVW